MVSLLNIRGYIQPDPLDKAPAWMRIILLLSVNLVLSIILINAVVDYKVVLFNGFLLFGHYFPPTITMVIETLVNCLIFSPLIIWLRKCSSLVPYGIVFLPYYLLDLFNESHIRCANQDTLQTLWGYNNGSIVSGIYPAALKFFVTLSVDGLVFGVISLFIARLLAGVIYSGKKYPERATRQQYDLLFNQDWSRENITRPKRDAAFYLLRILGFGYLVYLSILVLGLFGRYAWPEGIGKLILLTYDNPALAINTYFKITLMIMLAFIGAYNKSLRYFACLALLSAHIASTTYALVFHFVKSLGASDPTDFLLLSAITDGALIILFTWIVIKYKKDATPFFPEKEFPAYFSTPLTIMATLYKALFIIFTALVIGIIGIRILGAGYSGLGAVYGSPDPMVGNTVTLYTALAVICWLLVGRERLRQHFFNALTVPLIFGSVVSILWIIIADISGGVYLHTRHDTYVQVDWYFILYAVLNLMVVFCLVLLRRMYYRVDYSINTLGPSAAIDAMALTHAFFNSDEKKNSAVLQLIDQYAGGISGRKRGLLNLPFSLFENYLSFIYGLRPPFATMSRDEQRFYLKEYFFRNENERNLSMVPFLAEFSYQVGTSLNAIVSFANYSHLNTRYQIGYIPADARDRLQGEVASHPPPFKNIAALPKDVDDPVNFRPDTPAGTRLVAPRVTTPTHEPEIPDEIDYLVVGSGAGGATAAYKLSCSVKIPRAYWS